MHNVPIQNAIIVAHPASGGPNARVKVVTFGSRELRKFDLSFGACEDRWVRAPDQQLGFIYEIAWHLAHVFKISTNTIHEALQAIPEYRTLEGNDR